MKFGFQIFSESQFSIENEIQTKEVLVISDSRNRPIIIFISLTYHQKQEK